MKDSEKYGRMLETFVEAFMQAVSVSGVYNIETEYDANGIRYHLKLTSYHVDPAKEKEDLH